MELKNKLIQALKELQLIREGEIAELSWEEMMNEINEDNCIDDNEFNK